MSDKETERLFEKALVATTTKRSRGATVSAPLTADELAKNIRERLGKFAHNILNVSRTKKPLTDTESVYIKYANVPKGSPELDALNAKSNLMISIYPGKSQNWPLNTPAPAKLKTEMFQGMLSNHARFRGKTASPQKIADHIVKFFEDNEEALL